mmetsp:Transcript_90486/g.290078  ORF Transcript_90486/g.290078 Transcript_90486/m.290078 type:complete len:234 (+) Transcript_90486:330-1031(+)
MGRWLLPAVGASDLFVAASKAWRHASAKLRSLMQSVGTFARRLWTCGGTKAKALVANLGGWSSSGPRPLHCLTTTAARASAATSSEAAPTPLLARAVAALPSPPPLTARSASALGPTFDSSKLRLLMRSVATFARGVWTSGGTKAKAFVATLRGLRSISGNRSIFGEAPCLEPLLRCGTSPNSPQAEATPEAAEARSRRSAGGGGMSSWADMAHVESVWRRRSMGSDPAREHS